MREGGGFYTVESVMLRQGIFVGAENRVEDGLKLREFGGPTTD